jgi:hypothetical protein
MKPRSHLLLKFSSSLKVDMLLHDIQLPQGFIDVVHGGTTKQLMIKKEQGGGQAHEREEAKREEKTRGESLNALW